MTANGLHTRKKHSKPLRLGLLCLIMMVVVPLVARVSPAVHAYNLESCKWSSHVVYYYNAVTSNNENSKVPLAAEAWNDAPVQMYLSPVSSFLSANITVYSISDPSKPTAFTPVACSSNGLFGGQIQITLNDYLIGNLPEDQITGIIAHEFGHALGLGHSAVQSSLMLGDPYGKSSDAYNNYGIFLPVVDDIKALASVYGWAADTTFGSAFTSGSGFASGTATPITLEIGSPAAGSLAKVSTSSTLPSSHIAVKTAYVTPSILYRMNVGWEADATHSFAQIEIDDDCIRFVSYVLAIPRTCFAGTATSGTSYFLELVVRVLLSDSLTVRADAYVFQGSMQTANAGETFQGHFGANLVYCTIGVAGCPTYYGWSDAGAFVAASWTDSSSDPASTYTVNHFWNFQGSTSKPASRFRFQISL